MLTHHTEEELAGKTETPHLAGRVMAALAADPDAMRLTGQVVDVGEMAEHYGIDDLDGTRPQGNAGRYLPSPVPPPLPPKTAELAARQQDRELLRGLPGQPAAERGDHRAGLGDRHADARAGDLADVLAGEPIER